MPSLAPFLRGCLAAFLLTSAVAAHAQSPAPTPAPASDAPLVLTLERAVDIALRNNSSVQTARLDMREADAQVREAWGQVLPSLDLTSSYTRNVVQANPFAGSDISSFLGGGTQGEWVAFNERARLDGDPTTDPISFDAFAQRQRDSLRAAGVSLGGGGNPFGIDNEFRTGLQLTQTLYSGQAFSAIQGAAQFKSVRRLARNRQVQEVAGEVFAAFYRALLAQEQARVVKQRVARSEETLQEISTRVAQGVTPKFQRLSAEVELSNAETELIQAQNQAASAVDNLALTLGLSGDAQVRLDGALDASSLDLYQEISTTRAVETAIQNRADLEQARLRIELEDIQRQTTRAQYFPRVEAVANFAYTGRVPDDRTQVLTTDPDDPTNPFFFDERTPGFFDTSFWDPSLSVGLRVSWNLFNGFQTSAQMQQREIAIQRAEVQRDQLRRQVETEVRQAIRTLNAARQRIESQQQTVNRAELNYEHTSTRVAQGVSSPLELREASDQLDQSRLNYLQAVYDYLVARSDLETALGVPLSTAAGDDLQMTRR